MKPNFLSQSGAKSPPTGPDSPPTPGPDKRNTEDQGSSELLPKADPKGVGSDVDTGRKSFKL